MPHINRPYVSVRFASVAGVEVLCLSGDLDLATAPAAEAAMVAARLRSPHPIIDLSDLRFCDCAGVGMLLRVAAVYRASGGMLRLAAPRGIVAEVLTLCGVEEFIAVRGTVAGAVALDNPDDQPSMTAGDSWELAGRLPVLED
jgi:anti-anti-sigma factor